MYTTILFKSYQLPIFLSYLGLDHSQVILFKKRYLGRLVQYLPVHKLEDQKFIVWHDDNLVFYHLKFYAEDEDLLQKVLKSGDDWLKEYDNPGAYLKTKAWLSVGVRFAFEPDKNFVGYLFEIDQK